MDYKLRVITDIELHSVEGIRECFENGVSPNDYYNNKPLFNELITEYSRGPAFRECVRLFIEFGLHFTDEALMAVFCNDPVVLQARLDVDNTIISRTYSFDCTFTPLLDATLLHICAEYNHVACAELLIKHGADVNARAGVDSVGFGAQTPIFHTVNQNSNKCIDMMRLLLAQGADPLINVKGLNWGKGYQWETFIPAVNAISYAMMGLLRQFQRTEENIYVVVSELMQCAYGIDYKPSNVPNAYLNPAP